MRVSKGRMQEQATGNIEALSPPQVGVGVITRKDGRVLIGKRLGSGVGGGSWQFTGGKLESFESVENCAFRETLEEAGIRIENMRVGPYTNDIFPEHNKHFVTLFIIADWQSGQPVAKEPEKCSEWLWAPWENLPRPLFLPIENLLRLNFNPFEF